MRLAYEYAGGRSDPPPVTVDGPDTAEAGSPLEYSAEGSMSNIQDFRVAGWVTHAVHPLALGLGFSSPRPHVLWFYPGQLRN